MSDYANHIDYRLNEITGDRRTLIEVSKLHGIPNALTLQRCRERQAAGMTTKLLCTQYEVDPAAAAVCAATVTRRGGAYPVQDLLHIPGRVASFLTQILGYVG